MLGERSCDFIRRFDYPISNALQCNQIKIIKLLNKSSKAMNCHYHDFNADYDSSIKRQGNKQR